jgi:RIO kinase 2
MGFCFGGNADDSSYFMRDVNCIRKFFRKRFRYEAESWPRWRDVLAGEDEEEEEEEQEGGAKEEVESGQTGEGSSGVEQDGELKGNEAQVEEGKGGESKGNKKRRIRLDLEVEASGFGGALQDELEEVSWHS